MANECNVTIFVTNLVTHRCCIMVARFLRIISSSITENYFLGVLYKNNTTMGGGLMQLVAYGA